MTFVSIEWAGLKPWLERRAESREAGLHSPLGWKLFALAGRNNQ